MAKGIPLKKRLEVETDVVAGARMVDICRDNEMRPRGVADIARSVGLTPPPEEELPESEALAILRSVRTIAEAEEASMCLGVSMLRIRELVIGAGREVPAAYRKRKDLGRSHVCMIHEGLEWGDRPVHPHLSKFIRSGKLRTDVTVGEFELEEYPALRLRVLDELHARGACGPLANEEIIQELADKCGVSYLSVWRVAMELENPPPNTLSWHGARARWLKKPDIVPVGLGMPLERLEEHEILMLRERHANWDIRDFWVPFEVWYKLGLHGVKGSLRYPAPKDLPTREEARPIPDLGGRRADRLGRIFTVRGCISPRFRTHIIQVRKAYLRADRLVYEAFNDCILGPKELVIHKNGFERDCRPENLTL